MTEPTIHPAANLFLLLEGQPFEDFKEDIGLHGLREAIALLDGQILDGRNRFRACKELGVEPHYHILPDDTDPIAYVLSANLHRRHLDTSQRAMAGAKAKVMYEEKARERERAGKSRDGTGGGRGRKKKAQEDDDENPVQNSAQGNGRSRDKAAEAVNVSHASIDAATEVLDKGTPDLARLVESGEVSVSAAAAVASLPLPEQEEVVAAGPSEIRKRAKEIREGVPPMPEEDPEAENLATAGQKWCEFLHKVYVMTNSVRDAGGIEHLSRNWSAVEKANTATELKRIGSVLSTWIDYLKE